MTTRGTSRRSGGGWWRPAVLAALVGSVQAADILNTVGFSNCGKNATVRVQKADILYNNEDKTVSFNVVGTSTQVQNVTAVLNVMAYGQQIYNNSFDPCDAKTFVDQLCPVPAGTFSAKGVQAIPKQFADMVPAIAFQIPDIAAMAKLELRAKDTRQNVACVQSQVSNGKTASVPAVSYVAATLAGAALIMGGVTAAGAAFSAGGAAAVAGGGPAGTTSTGGSGALSPSFTEVFGWFQGMAMNGMLSVNYPQVYRSFAANFAFSTGLIPWTSVQVAIDNFRGATGGNLTNDSVETLRMATLVFPDGSTKAGNSSMTNVKRALDHFAYLAARQNGIETSVNTTVPDAAPAADPNSATESIRVAVSGIEAYVKQLSIPSANTFMTVLLIVAIVIAAIAVGILLVKVILELWALFGTFPKALAGFRKHYWGSIARAITSLILLLYGIWVLYCVFQFTHGDSWAAKTLAGVTLFVFTAILVFFSWKIWSTARRLKRNEGTVVGLYEDKSIWVKYSLFYEAYRKNYWWIFVPTIVYMFVKGVALAVGDGNGRAQTIAQLIIEAVMLGVLLWSRPYERKSGNVINITIQVVRVLSVVCILVFVQEFGIAQTTQTVTGVVLIAVQSALTGILAILILWNAINACCKANPHRKRRKELEKAREDNLTPLDARNSLLLERNKHDLSDTFAISNTVTESKPTLPLYAQRGSSGYADSYSEKQPYAQQHASKPSVSSIGSNNNGMYRPLTPSTPLNAVGDQSREGLLGGAAPIGRMGTAPPPPQLMPGFSAGGNGGGYGYRPGPRYAPQNGPYGGNGGGYGGYGGGY